MNMKLSEQVEHHLNYGISSDQLEELLTGDKPYFDKFLDTLTLELMSEDQSLSDEDSYGNTSYSSSAVWKFSNGTEECYFKIMGRYASYVGYEVEGFREVFPTTKTVTTFS